MVWDGSLGLCPLSRNSWTCTTLLNALGGQREAWACAWNVYRDTQEPAGWIYIQCSCCPWQARVLCPAAGWGHGPGPSLPWPTVCSANGNLPDFQGPNPEYSSLSRPTPSVKNISSSCGLPQPSVPWRAQGGLYDNDEGTSLPPGVNYKLLECMVCGLSSLRF